MRSSEPCHRAVGAATSARSKPQGLVKAKSSSSHPSTPRRRPSWNEAAYVLAELAREHGPVDIGQERFERGDDAGGGDIFQVLALFDQVRPEAVLAFQGGPELGHVVLAHAGGPVEASGAVGRHPGDHQDSLGSRQPGGAGEGVGPAPGPARHQAPVGTYGLQDGGRCRRPRQLRPDPVGGSNLHSPAATW